MNEINFLPEQFVHEQARAQRRFRHVIVIAVVATCMFGQVVIHRHSLSWRQAEAKALEADAAVAQNLKSEIAQLQKRHGALSHELTMHRELVLPLRHSQMIAALGQSMPPSIALSSMNVETQLPPPISLDKKSAEKNKNAGALPLKKPMLNVQMTGLAADDLEVANFVGALSDHPLFHDVKMHSSKPTTVGTLIGREFSISMQVPLDREYRPAEDDPALAGAGEPTEQTAEVPDAH